MKKKSIKVLCFIFMFMFVFSTTAFAAAEVPEDLEPPKGLTTDTIITNDNLPFILEHYGMTKCPHRETMDVNDAEEITTIGDLQELIKALRQLPDEITKTSFAQNRHELDYVTERGTKIVYKDVWYGDNNIEWRTTYTASGNYSGNYWISPGSYADIEVTVNWPGMTHEINQPSIDLIATNPGISRALLEMHNDYTVEHYLYGSFLAGTTDIISIITWGNMHI